MSEIDYGARLRAVANYLKTVPGDKYNFGMLPNESFAEGNHCGCIIFHGMDMGTIPRNFDIDYSIDADYGHGQEWLIESQEAFSNMMNEVRWPAVNGYGPTGIGEDAKQVAIACMEAYADRLYPKITKCEHTTIPDSVLAIFEGRRTVELTNE